MQRFFFFCFRKVDIYIGGLDNSRKLPTGLTTTRSYYSDDLTWCFRKLEPERSWTDLFGVLTIGSWLMVVASVMIHSVILFFFARLDYISRDWMYYLHTCFFLFLGAPGFYRPRSNVIRCVYSIHLIVGIAWNAIFCSLWISSISKEGRLSVAQISSIEEAIDNNYQLVGRINIFDYKVLIIFVLLIKSDRSMQN